MLRNYKFIPIFYLIVSQLFSQNLYNVAENDTTLLPPSSLNGGVLYTSLNQYGMSDYDWATAIDPEMPIFLWDTQSPDSWDVLVEQQLQARLPFITMTTRGVNTPGDRSDLGGVGNQNPYRLTGLVDAFERAGIDSSIMKIMCFLDTGPIPIWQDQLYPDHELKDNYDWSHEESWNTILWKRMIEPWFETIPEDLWFRIEGRPIIQFWGVNPAKHSNHYGNISKAFTFIAHEFETRFNERPWMVIDEGGFQHDGTLKNCEDFFASAGWFDVDGVSKSSWGIPAKHNGRTVGGGCPGFVCPSGNRNRIIKRDNGNALLECLEAAKNQKVDYMLVEGWGDLVEGAGLYRSEHTNWDFSNQYINMFREFTDPKTETIRLEAEGVDFYFDSTPGNVGEKYRREGDLDIADMPNGNGWYVGWTTAGEWMEYKNVYFSESDYKFPIKYACPVNQIINLEVDGVSLGNVEVPATGGWDKFKTVFLGFTHLNQGQHTLRVNFVTGEVNVDWLFVKKGIVPSNVSLPANPVKISSKHSSKVISLESNSSENGINIVQNSFNNNASQIWNIASIGQGYYKITNLSSGKNLQVSDADTSNGANINQSDWSNDENQMWSIQDLGDGNSRLVAVSSGKSVEVAAFSADDGANIRQGNWNDSDNQIWIIESVDVADAPPGLASNPKPLNGVDGVSETVKLSWTPGMNTVTNKIYLGTQEILTEENLVGRIADTEYLAENLLYEQTYFWRVDEVNDSGTTIGEVWSFITKSEVIQVPRNGIKWTIPGIIQLEDFDDGDINTSYFDKTTGNEGDVYRISLDVDIAETNDFGGGYHIGWIDDGEWLEYTLDDVTDGNYTVNFRVASANDNENFVTLSINDQEIGTVDIPNTGNLDTWQTIQLKNIVISEGKDQVLRVALNGGGFNINHITFFNEQTRYTYHEFPGYLEAEHFDFGGEGISYHDSDSVNTGGENRPSECVDIVATSDTSGLYSIASTSEGEWLEYSISEITTALYTIELRVASAVEIPNGITLELDGTVLTSFNVKDTGGEDNWENIKIGGIAIPKSSNKILKVIFNGAGINLNHITFSNVRAAFVDQYIPGVIEVENFDYGGEGIAYHDENPTDGVHSARPNEGVGTEPTDDVDGGGYNVGWINSNEWLEYSLLDVEDGIYDVSIRVASTIGGGPIQIIQIKGDTQNDNIILGSFNVPNTGGWQTYETVTKNNIEIRSGESNIIRMYFEGADCNVNWIGFEKTGIVGVENPKDIIPVEYSLEQNYPNPFNPATTINFSVPKASNVELNIYNVLGQKVAVLMNRDLNAGNYSVAWNAEKFSSGIYIVTLKSSSIFFSKKMLLLK